MEPKDEEILSGIAMHVGGWKPVDSAPVMLVPGVLASDYALKELSQALAKAQVKYDAATRDAENKFEGFRYVELNSIIKAVRPHLAENGLVAMQFSTADLEEKTVTVTTRLSHSSGEWVQSDLVLPAEGTGKGGTPTFNQKTIGAAITYGRKYGLKTLAGLADSSDEDVDKQEGNPDLSRAPKRENPKPVPAGYATQKDYAINGPETAKELPGRLLTIAERKKMFQDCYNTGAGNEHVLEAVKLVTKQDNTKLVTVSQVGEIVRQAAIIYRRNDPLPEDAAEVADALEGEIIP
jgi:hypothetical protein